MKIHELGLFVLTTLFVVVIGSLNAHADSLAIYTINEAGFDRNGGGFEDFRVNSMFARLAQVTAKPGQASNVSQAARERLIPMLKQQPGFIDTLGLSSDKDPNQYVGITLWNSKEDAEKALASQQGQQFLQSIRPLIQGDPTFRSFNVETSTMHGLGITKAATSS